MPKDFLAGSKMTNAKLIIFSSDQPEREVELYGEASVGRAPDNSICIDDQAVSQYHAIIERRGDEFWLSDLGSTNGTTINSEPVDTGAQTPQRRFDFHRRRGLDSVSFRRRFA